MKNKLADREASYEILLHAKEELVEAQRALEEQLENNTERKDREIGHLRSSFSASYNELDGSLVTLRQELNRLTSSLEVSRKQNGSLEEKIKVKTTEAESTYAELLKLRASLATAEKKAADDLKDAQRENERQSSQVTMLRKNLDRSRLEEKARDDAVTELKNQLKEAGDERRMKENELQASASRQAELESRLSKQIEDAEGLERELTDTKGKLVQLTILSQKRGLELVSTQKQSDDMRSDITKVKDHAAKLNIEMLQLKLQLRDSNEECSMLEGKVRRGETEAQVLEERIDTLQREHREMQEMVFTRGHGLEESKKALEAAKTEAITFLSSSLQHSQNVVEELKKQKEVLEQQSAERQATMERQRDEIKGNARLHGR
ncbi:hypothetical protein F5887DRAFT_1070862 [Amanita rubescens]|nr:hypothetical protein F5887DRAFT_1070862 [Amanita rubescens]